jgi:serine phosphatase RsbU (regulator of sigma subunit)
MSFFLALATLNLCLGGLVLLLGMLILRENPHQRLNRVVASMLFFGGVGAILGALGFLAASAGGAGGAGSRFAFGSLQNFAYLWEFFFPALFVFASIFPEERPFTRRVPSFEPLVFTPHAFHFALLLGLTLLPREIVVPQLDVPASRTFLGVAGLFLKLFLRVHQALFSLVNLGYGIATAVLLTQSYRRAEVPRLKRQLGAIGLGLTTCLALYSLSSSIPTLLAVQIPLWAQSLLTTAALTACSGAIAYAIVRHKFLDARLLARRAILYAVASTLLVGFYLAVVVPVKALFMSVTGLDGRVLEPVVLILALITYQPVILWLEQRLEAVFLRDPADYRNVLRHLGHELLTTIDLDAMLSRSIRTIADALLLRSASVVALAHDGPIVRVGAGASVARDDLPALAAAVLRLPHHRDTFRLSERLLGMQPADRALFAERLGAALVIPLRSKGETVGALLLGPKLTDTESTAEDVALLAALAGQMSVALQNGLLLRERVAVARLDEELSLARKIQQTFLPSEFPRMPHLDVHAINVTSKQVGGDLYDLVPAGDGAYYLAIADVSGKGIPAALLSSMLQASLRTQAESVRSVSEILRNINALVYRSTTQEQFATCFLARIEENGLRMSFSNAGHNYPVVLRHGGGRQTLERGGLILGILDGIPFEEEEIALAPGDRVVLYTDGLNEARNAAGEDFGEERICDVVRALPAHLTAKEVADHVLAALRQFLGDEEPQDDVTIMVLRVPLRADDLRTTSPRRTPTESALGS